MHSLKPTLHCQKFTHARQERNLEIGTSPSPGVYVTMFTDSRGDTISSRLSVPPHTFPLYLLHLHQIRLNRFFLGMLLTLIFFMGPVWFFRGLKRFTWSPTLIFLVSAPWGNTACTCGTTVDDTIPPSGPMACTWRKEEQTTS